MKVTLLTILLLTLVTLGFAFESTLMLKGGISQAETDIYQDKQINGMIGISYEIWLAKWISLGLHPYITKVGAGKEDEIINFEANVVGADMLFRLRPNWKHVAPYITAGGGVSNFYPKSQSGVYYPGTDHTVGVLPTVGAGLTFFTKYGIDFDLGFQKNFLMSDELEGWEKGEFDDSYWMAFLGISHTFGKKKPAPVVVPPPVVIPEAPKPVLTITPNTHEVGYRAGEAEFAITANNPWTVSENETWFSVRPTSGTGNGIIEVTYDENTRPQPRTGNIYVSGGGLNLTLKVVQEGMPIPPLSLRNVYFEFDKHELTDAAITILNAIIANLAYYPEVQMEIQGHADEMGTLQYNQRLSERRANAVMEYLVNGGIAASRLTARGYGETRPATSNETDEGRALNRRVEFMQK
jgi:outer membrane protein OmpA-like peptidoglycan-associated protein